MTAAGEGGRAGEIGLRDLWRDAAEKDIEQGVDWPKIARTLFAEIDDLTERLDRLRHHIIADPLMRAMHENAKANSHALQALQARTGGPLSTTLAYVIEQGYVGYYAASVHENCPAPQADHGPTWHSRCRWPLHPWEADTPPHRPDTGGQDS